MNKLTLICILPALTVLCSCTSEVKEPTTTTTTTTHTSTTAPTPSSGPQSVRMGGGGY